MSDIYSKTKRSEIMSRVRGRRNLATEIALARLFRRYGIVGWRRRSSLIGRPDFVFPAHRLAVFVDGCFWHGCPQHGGQPRTNRRFWRRKLAGNKSRDYRVTALLTALGWGVLRIWQHELRAGEQARCLVRIQE